MPDKIPSLGVEHVTPESRAVLVQLLFGILCYFMFMFILDAIVDYVQWRATLRKEEAELDSEKSAHKNVVDWLANVEGYERVELSVILKAKFEVELVV